MFHGKSDDEVPEIGRRAANLLSIIFCVLHTFCVSHKA